MSSKPVLGISDWLRGADACPSPQLETRVGFGCEILNRRIPVYSQSAQNQVQTGQANCKPDFPRIGSLLGGRRDESALGSF
jgi:hypothetical protein